MIISMLYHKVEQRLFVLHVPQLRIDRSSTVKDLAQRILGDDIDIGTWYVDKSMPMEVEVSGKMFRGYNLMYMPFEKFDMSPYS